MSPRKERAYNLKDVDPDTFGAQLRRLREDAGISQEELADEIGVSQQRISLYERNVNVPGEDKLIDIAEVLRVPPSRLFEGSRFGGVLPLGPDLRQRLGRLHARELRDLDRFLDAADDLTPELRARFAERLDAFLTTWKDEDQQ